MKKSEIRFDVTVDNEFIPHSIEWQATDSGMEGKKPCLATLLSLWDPNEKATLRIDLWTKDMLVDDMKRFFYENFVTLADTYQRATNDTEAAGMIRDFAKSFGEKTGLFGKPKP
jgi:gliding motility-associated protein GldC